MSYYLILSFHLISIIIWIGTLFAIQRLIYIQKNNAKAFVQEEAILLFKKLANPSFFFTIVFGIILIGLNKSILQTGFWIYLKFFLISLIIMLHHMSKTYIYKLNKNALNKSENVIFYHSVMPFFLFSLVALLTILKPF